MIYTRGTSCTYMAMGGVLYKFTGRRPRILIFLIECPRVFFYRSDKNTPLYPSSYANIYLRDPSFPALPYLLSRLLTLHLIHSVPATPHLTPEPSCRVEGGGAWFKIKH